MAAEDSAGLRIDAHQHFWRVARGDYGWLTPGLAPLYRDFGPEDLAPLLRERGIDATVLVQAAATREETAFLLEIAERTSWVAGVVGWEDFAAPDAAQRIRALARRPKLIGLRPMIQDIPDDDWMLRPDLGPAFAALVETDLAFDALVFPRHLPRLRRLLERFPALRTVVDHGAKPQIRDWSPAGPEFRAWADDMRGIARDSAAGCKLSGLATEAAPGWDAEALRPYVELLLDAFGPDRLMWGSDWPVLTLNGSYGAWWEATQRLLAGAAGAAPVLGGTAKRFYRLAA